MSTCCPYKRVEKDNGASKCRFYKKGKLSRPGLAERLDEYKNIFECAHYFDDSGIMNFYPECGSKDRAKASDSGAIDTAYPGYKETASSGYMATKSDLTQPDQLPEAKKLPDNYNEEWVAFPKADLVIRYMYSKKTPGSLEFELFELNGWEDDENENPVKPLLSEDAKPTVSGLIMFNGTMYVAAHGKIVLPAPAFVKAFNAVLLAAFKKAKDIGLSVEELS